MDEVDIERVLGGFSVVTPVDVFNVKPVVEDVKPVGDLDGSSDVTPADVPTVIAVVDVEEVDGFSDVLVVVTDVSITPADELTVVLEVEPGIV